MSSQLQELVQQYSTVETAEEKGGVNLTVLIPYENLKSMVVNVLTNLGVSEPEAVDTAEAILAADLRE